MHIPSKRLMWGTQLPLIARCGVRTWPKSRVAPVLLYGVWFWRWSGNRKFACLRSAFSCPPEVFNSVNLLSVQKRFKSGTFSSGTHCAVSSKCYWAVQAGLLTPLTFTKRWPLGRFFLPVRIVFTMEGGDSQFAKFTVLSLKAYLKALSQTVSGSKQ